MIKILAVSGGIDSMAMLRMEWERNIEQAFRHRYDSSLPEADKIVVAHLNHGTRPSADEDEAFVREWAELFGFPFETAKVELGPDVSEEEARSVRYDFLFHVAAKYSDMLGERAEVYTAQHFGDALESIIINLVRGTGWRGLAPMRSPDVHRYFNPIYLRFTRKDILRYAGKENRKAERDPGRAPLDFREDPTNHEEKYLRNRIRMRLEEFDDKNEALVTMMHVLYERQCILADEIDDILREIVPYDGIYQREWFYGMDDSVAIEILREGLLWAGVRATRVQIHKFLKAIRSYEPEKKFNLPGGKLITIHRNYFELK